ncbi:MAG TPA: diacylglycerol kinase family protein [Terriglobia bacterium]|nr:diacylglycerol kinase family protein [Terriglobia bacterium]
MPGSGGALLPNGLVVIANPRAANGKAARVIARLAPRLPAHTLLHTESPGHATELAAEMLHQGAHTIVAAGGDGTIHEVVNGFFDAGAPIAPDARLAIIPCGTGSDFRRGAHIPADPEAAAGLVSNGVAKPIDALRVTYTTASEEQRTEYAINVVSFGLGAEATARANRMSKALGGRLTYALAALMSAAQFECPAVEIRIDGHADFQGRMLQVAAGNGRFHGGGMEICPQAAMDDGWIDVTRIGPLGMGGILRNLPLLYRGRILTLRATSSCRAKSVTASSRERVLVELDGETRGMLPIEIAILPAALNLLIPRQLTE